jgi:hypothetical protein
MQRRLDRRPEVARLRRQTVEHVFGTLKAWTGPTHFLTKTLPRVGTEMSLNVLAYNLKRAIQILGVEPLKSHSAIRLSALLALRSQPLTLEEGSDGSFTSAPQRPRFCTASVGTRH